MMNRESAKFAKNGRKMKMEQKISRKKDFDFLRGLRAFAVRIGV